MNASVKFHGDDYDELRDEPRLKGQLRRVYNVMRDGRYRSTEEIVQELMRRGGKREKGESIARQVRYLKDLPGFTVLRRYDGEGLYRHRLVVDDGQERLAI